jgi:hypothetical protein
VAEELLHVFGLRLWLADIDAIDKCRQQIVIECTAYLDDLHKQHKLLAQPSDQESFNHGESYDGLGYKERNTDDFKYLHRYLSKLRLILGDNELPALANKLLENLKADSSLFCEQINSATQGSQSFAHIPILQHLAPNEFIDAAFLHYGHARYNVFIALKNRYEFASASVLLVVERLWLENLRKKFKEIGKKSHPIKRANIELILKNWIDPILKSDEAS